MTITIEKLPSKCLHRAHLEVPEEHLGQCIFVEGVREQVLQYDDAALLGVHEQVPEQGSWGQL